MPRMVCVRDGRFLKIKKNGVPIEEDMVRQSGDRAPYKLWQGDLYECPQCGSEIIAGFGQAPIAEHYEADYAAKVSRREPLLRVI